LALGWDRDEVGYHLGHSSQERNIPLDSRVLPSFKREVRALPSKNPPLTTSLFQGRALAGRGMSALVRAAMCKHTGEEAAGRGPALVMDEAVAATLCGCNSNGHTGRELGQARG